MSSQSTGLFGKFAHATSHSEVIQCVALDSSELEGKDPLASTPVNFCGISKGGPEHLAFEIIKTALKAAQQHAWKAKHGH